LLKEEANNYLKIKKILNHFWKQQECKKIYMIQISDQIQAREKVN
jgi:hypothetical protein